MEPERTIIDSPQAEQEVVEEDRTEDEVKDAVPNHLGCNGNSISSFTKTPRDGVDQGDEGDETRAADVAAADTLACVECGARTVTEERGPTNEKY